MRTQPPCMKNGIDCPRRKMWCHGLCKEYKEWEAVEGQRKDIANKEKEKNWITFSDRIKKSVNKKIKEGRK